jgi:hypothetical protein
MKEYYLNVASWLKPPPRADRTLWTVLQSFPLCEEISPEMPAEKMGSLALVLMPLFFGSSGPKNWLVGLRPDLNLSELPEPKDNQVAVVVGAVLNQMLKWMINQRPGNHFSVELPDADELKKLVTDGITAGAAVLHRGGATKLADALTKGH